MTSDLTLWLVFFAGLCLGAVVGMLLLWWIFAREERRWNAALEIDQDAIRTVASRGPSTEPWND